MVSERLMMRLITGASRSIHDFKSDVGIESNSLDFDFCFNTSFFTSFSDSGTKLVKTLVPGGFSSYSNAFSIPSLKFARIFSILLWKN